jgi:hypothetical protein
MFSVMESTMLIIKYEICERQLTSPTLYLLQVVFSTIGSVTPVQMETWM